MEENVSGYNMLNFIRQGLRMLMSVSLGLLNFNKKGRLSRLIILLWFLNGSSMLKNIVE